MTKLSVVVIAKDEEKNIRDCLERVKWADEIIIIDDFSRDKTTEIAREFTSKIYRHRMEGFGQQRNFGIDKTKGDWIYFADADDRVTPELRDEILATIKNPKYNAYKIYQKTNYLGRWIRYCGWYAPVMKLLKNGKARFNFEKAIEKPVVEGKIGCLKNPVLHTGYPDISTHIKKISLYSKYEAETMAGKGVEFKRYNLAWYFLIRPLVKFFQKYIYLKGYREGMHGFILSAMNAFYLFLIYAVAWERGKDETVGKKNRN